MAKSRMLGAAFASALLVASTIAGAVAWAPAASATGPANGWAPEAPDGQAPWPVCADEASQYCIETASLDGVVNPSLASVSILPGGDGDGQAPWDSPQSINWAIDALYNVNGDTANINKVASITVRTGSFDPLYTTARARDFTLTTSETDGNHKLTVTGKPMRAFWNFQNDDAVATIDVLAFSGNTQNMSSWGEDAITRFGGMYIATNAQAYAPIVNFSSDPEDHWELALANPHFRTDGSTQASGSFEAFVPPNYFQSIGREPGDTDFVATRIDGSVTSPLSGSTTRMNGGAKLTIPDLTYSSPTVSVKTVPRRYAPGTPRSVSLIAKPPNTRVASWAAPSSNGGSPIAGYRVVVERVTSAANQPVVWGPVSNTVQTGLTKQFVPQFTSRYRVRVAAINSVGTGSYSVATAPTAPTSPKSLAVVEKPQNKRVASWLAPTSNGGSAITGYRVIVERAEMNPVGMLIWAPVTNTVQATRTKQFLVTLKSKYRVRVAAINAVGSSNFVIQNTAGKH